MRIIVTGGSGFIGCNLIKALRSLEHQVCNVDIAKNARPIDIRNFPVMQRVFNESKPDIVVHLAALASVPLCEKKPYESYETNVLGTLNVIRCAAKFKAKIILASSAAVYGVSKSFPLSENMPLNPKNVYGATKLAAEHIVELQSENNFVVFRIFNTFGPYCLRSYVIPDIVRKLVAGHDPVPLLGLGKERRDFIYISDVIDAFFIAIESDLVGVYNLGSGKTTSIRDLSKKIANIMKLNVHFTFEGRMREGDVMISHADITKLREECGWHPRTSLEEGLEKTIEWYMNKYKVSQTEQPI